MYVLKSQKHNVFYIGCTEDLRQRILQHNKGSSKATKHSAPWALLYYEAYTSLKLARNREIKLKHHGKGLSELKKRILED